MAAPQVPQVNYLEQIMADANLITAIGAITERTRVPIQVIPTDAELQDELPTYETLSNLLMLAVNGAIELPEQKVSIEYLRGDQKMTIPLALGMNPITNGVARVAQQTRLVARYWKVASMSYGEVRALFLPNYNAARIKDQIDARQTAAGNVLFNGWNEATFYDLDEAANDPVGFSDVIYSGISSALQFNCDIRDVGFLNTPDSYLSDDSWMTAAAVTSDRLKIKLRPRSVNCIAALNLAAVANEPLAAYVRAYGLALGILPAPDSVTNKEFRFDVRMPTAENYRTVNTFHRNYERPLVTPCAQILAMFGLFHLAKDHTFKTNDATLARIGNSFVMTLRTDMPVATLDRIKQNLEPFVRTAPHPFGLGQTYWLARVLGFQGKLVLPLAVRLDVTPPPVQRLMIAQATRMEWMGLPAGRSVDSMFRNFYAGMAAEIDKIYANPPAYSALHRLYGIERQQFVDPQVMANVQSMMPTVYGYVMVNHKNEKDELDGLALALSLKNVQRDQKGLVTLWETAWQKYSTAVEEAGILEFVQHMSMLQPSPPAT